MKVTGFTFIKNALIYDYPIVEAIKSILPICNEFVVDVGSMTKFKGNHPKIMDKRIKEKNWSFEDDISFNNLSLKDKFKNFMYKNFNWDMNYKNYKLR